ncbi:hypothetical protein BS329_19620 [Amycolatopsis coloradensis]|uniref:AB hydrolase-1 domain-containing protein n=1 Tax=Amycolatopsis coloradensis TaxID=76021 RepID=A0A1R0KS87_9PSEU|nr:hypothetical protein BS329_19620 [Amycolatopsis coloradensis]
MGVADDLAGHVVQDCGHIIPLDRPQELLRIRRWLSVVAECRFRSRIRPLTAAQPPVTMAWHRSSSRGRRPARRCRAAAWPR